MDGSLPKEGTMIINEEGDIALAVSNGKYCVRKYYDEANFLFDMNVENCYIHEDEGTNGAVPEIKTGMMPVIISADGTTRKSHITSKWYDYDLKMWANVVTLK